jgi:plasmid stabilization system protein ParE
MKRRLDISEEAYNDVAQAWTWYEDQRVGLGDSFIVSYREALDRIERRPESFALVNADVRRAMMRRFPFGVHYLIYSDRIVILAVFHSSRDPSRWQNPIQFDE